MRGLLPRFTHVLTLDVKGHDPVISRYGGTRVKGFPSKYDILKADLSDGNRAMRFRVHPGGMGAEAIRGFWHAMNGAWASGNSPGRKSEGTWVVNFDEARVMADLLKMKAHLIKLWVMGRSQGVTVVAGTQAPRFVPSEFYDQATWLAIGRFRDERIIKRLTEIAGSIGDGVDLKTILPSLVKTKTRREFLIIGPDDYVTITSWEPTKGDKGNRDKAIARLRKLRAEI